MNSGKMDSFDYGGRRKNAMNKIKFIEKWHLSIITLLTRLLYILCESSVYK